MGTNYSASAREPGKRSDYPVVVRFGMNTPFWPLSMTYGVFYDPVNKLWMVSLDHYIAHAMFCRPENQREIMNSPNGYLAYQNMNRILASTISIDGDPVIRENWDSVRDQVMLRGMMLKFSQNTAIRDMLLKTGEREIVDESRLDETHWCYAKGIGTNRHGTLLEEVRSRLREETDGEK